MSTKGSGRSATRVVGYLWEDDVGGGLDSNPIEQVLAQALRDGDITQYDTGRGWTLWIEGPPGSKIRAVRNAIDNLLPAGAKRVRDR